MNTNDNSKSGSVNGGSVQYHPTSGVRCLYVRDRRGNPVGVVLTQTTKGSDLVQVGWSLCKRGEDTFQKSEAKRLAYERLAPATSRVPFPKGLRDTPMNWALVSLAHDPSVPHTISSGAKREVQRRLGLPELPPPNASIAGAQMGSPLSATG